MSVFKELCTIPFPGSFKKVVCTKAVPEKLISFHRTMLQKLVPQDYKVLLLDTHNLEDFFAQLSITFLGQASIYAIKDSDLPDRDRKKLDAFLKDYAGPHTLYFFTSSPAYEKNALIIETLINQKLFQELAHLKGSQITQAFVEKIFTFKSAYTFDEACILLDYAHLLGARNEIFFLEWINRIVSDDASLFTLSQYFFAQQKKLLLTEWLRLKDRYSLEFWIAFFSEQLWQAIIYQQYAQKNKAMLAKRFTYRLPFSYLQKDWKKYSPEKLMRAHELLYDIDHGLKNGYASYGIELFIHTAFH